MMTFVSYAQNYEDVILRRALGEVENGFYVDVGANDPVIDSVTKAFYDAGWRGINIEPVREWYDKLRAQRPEDINLPFAAGRGEGQVDFYEVVGTGLSTMDRATARRHADERGYQLKSYRVEVKTLTSILEAQPCPVIHFLKIDVEGAERSVLEGLDLHANRPWIILIESTLPNSTIETHHEWEFILLAANYEFVYFDGLNRFYVAHEHRELGSKLAVPPNVFDNFQLSGFSSSSTHGQIARMRSELKEKVESIQSELDRLDEALQTQLLSMADKEVELDDVEQKFKDYKRRLDRLEQTQLHWKREAGRLKTELANVLASKSWRVTLPLRVLWKPFESRLGLGATRSDGHNASTPAAVETLARPASPGQANGVEGGMSTDEILKRIRLEVANIRQENKDWMK